MVFFRLSCSHRACGSPSSCPCFVATQCYGVEPTPSAGAEAPRAPHSPFGFFRFKSLSARPFQNSALTLSVVSPPCTPQTRFIEISFLFSVLKKLPNLRISQFLCLGFFLPIEDLRFFRPLVIQACPDDCGAFPSPPILLCSPHQMGNLACHICLWVGRTNSAPHLALRRPLSRPSLHRALLHRQPLSAYVSGPFGLASLCDTPTTFFFLCTVADPCERLLDMVLRRSASLPHCCDLTTRFSSHHQPLYFTSFDQGVYPIFSLFP